MILAPIIIVGICVAAILKAAINNYDAWTDPKYYVKQKEELKEYKKKLQDEVNWEENEKQRRLRNEAEMERFRKQLEDKRKFLDDMEQRRRKEYEDGLEQIKRNRPKRVLTEEMRRKNEEED